MLLFAYTSQYPVTSIADEPINQFKTVQGGYADTGASELRSLARSRLHLHMYALADKYDVPALKGQSKQRFLINFYHSDEYSPTLEEFPHTSLSKDDHDHEEAQIMSLVYTTTPHSDRGLRDIVLEYICRLRHEDTAYRGDLLQATAFRNLVAQNHEIATDFALHTNTVNKWKCDLCGARTKWLSRLCECGMVDKCKKENCLRKAKAATFCIHCTEHECLSPMKDH